MVVLVVVFMIVLVVVVDGSGSGCDSVNPIIIGHGKYYTIYTFLNYSMQVILRSLIEIK